MKREIYIASLLIFLITLGIFGAIIHLQIDTDIQFHADAVRNIFSGLKSLNPNFLYYVVLYVFSFFHTDQPTLFRSAAVLLSLAVTAKFILSQRFISTTLEDRIGRPSQTEGFFFNRITLIASVMLVFCYSIPFTYFLGGHFYLGNFPPNVWHNSTTIFVMPFVLLLFTASYGQLERPTNKGILVITVLSIINIFIKPSFFFCFCVVFPLFMLKQYGFKKQFWLNMVPVSLGVVLVWVLYFLMFTDGSGSGSGLAIRLFYVWSHYSIFIPISFLGSIFFPLLYTVFYWKELRNHLLFQYSVSLFLVAVIIFSTVIQQDAAILHGNFGWQYIMTNYILYMVFVTFLSRKIIMENKGALHLKDLLVSLGKKNRILVITFGIQFLLGIYYLLQIFLSSYRTVFI